MVSAISKNGQITTYEPNMEDVIMVVGEVGKLKKEHVVRLIKGDGFKKNCIAEEVFQQQPTENQIMWCLLKHKESSFAVVTERYALEQDLPF